MAKIRALLGGALLLVAGTCFADQWPDQSTVGDAQKEFAALSENGRAAYMRALIACSLYADDYDNANYENQCKTAYKGFKVEFGGTFIGVIFENAMLAAHTAGRIDTQQGSGANHDDRSAAITAGVRLARASIAALQKIYNEANLHTASVTTAPIRPAPKTAGQILVPLKRQGGTFIVPVLINNAIPLNFVVDSGAADVSIPADVVLTLIRTGTLQDTDFTGKQNYKQADGSIAPSATFRIRSLKVSGVEIGNVKASVAPVAGELLLGQSFLSRFKSWSIDNARQALVLTQSAEQMSAAQTGPTECVPSATPGLVTCRAGMPEAPLTPTGGGYAVQVSSQRSEEEARSSFRELQAKYPDLLGGRTPIIRRVDFGARGIIFRAMVGPFASADQAKELCSNLKAAGGICLVQKN